MSGAGDSPSRAGDVERLRATAQEYAAHATTLQLAFVGIATGLLEALHAAPASDRQLAERAALDPGYTKRWCDAAYAFGLLSYAGNVFALTPQGDAFRPSAAGTLMPIAVQSALGAHMAERAARYAATGERPGERELLGCQAALPWFGAMLEASFGGLFERAVLPALPVFEQLAARDGLAVDLGAGNGWYLRRLLARFPRLRGLGIDAFEENVRQAKARAEAEGLADRLRFAAGDAHALSFDEPPLLVAMNRALHHLWDERAALFARLRGALARGGAVVIWEPAWPLELETLASPRFRPMAFQNLSEHVQGNHFLRPSEIAQALEAAGFRAAVHTLAEGSEAVVVGSIG